jgi:hypothetical protein
VTNANRDKGVEIVESQPIWWGWLAPYPTPKVVGKGRIYPFKVFAKAIEEPAPIYGTIESGANNIAFGSSEDVSLLINLLMRSKTYVCQAHLTRLWNRGLQMRFIRWFR